MEAQDIELIKQTIRTAVLEGTAELVTKREFKDFRSEVLEAQQQFYNREVIDLKLTALQDELNAVRQESEKTRNVLANLWSSAGDGPS